MNYKTFSEWGYDLKNLCRLRRVLSTEAELFLLKTGRLEQSFVFLKKSWNLQSNFPDLEKVCKVEMKSGKMVKSRSFFFPCSNLIQFCPKSRNSITVTYRMRSCRTLLCFVLHLGYCTFAVHREKILLFPAVFKVSVDHRFDNLESGNSGSKNHRILKKGTGGFISPLNSNCNLYTF